MLEGPLVFLDIDTQARLPGPGGGVYCARIDRDRAQPRKLTQTAARHGIPILATACSHQARRSRALAVSRPIAWPARRGQERIPATPMPGLRGATGRKPLGGELPPHLTLEKNDLDMFSRSDADPIIERYNQGNPLFVVYGVATDYCVKKAVEGLLRRHCRMAIVVDAIRAIDPAAETGILTDFARRGVLLSVTRVVCDESPA